MDNRNKKLTGALGLAAAATTIATFFLLDLEEIASKWGISSNMELPSLPSGGATSGRWGSRWYFDNGDTRELDFSSVKLSTLDFATGYALRFSLDASLNSKRYIKAPLRLSFLARCKSLKVPFVVLKITLLPKGQPDSDEDLLAIDFSPIRLSVDDRGLRVFEGPPVKHTEPWVKIDLFVEDDGQIEINTNNEKAFEYYIRDFPHGTKLRFRIEGDGFWLDNLIFETILDHE